MQYARIAIIVICSVTLAGCATVRHAPLDTRSELLPGTYHKVSRGETLWRISKWYGVSLGELVAANNLSDATLIKTGQRIFIPGAEEEIIKNTASCDINKDPFIWPVGGRVKEYFGAERYSVRNKGIDISARAGESVRASGPGRVVFCSEEIKGYAKTVVIDHGQGLQTVYAHNSSIFVAKGDMVDQNDLIAKIGRPRRGDDAILHFEIRKKGDPQNPLHYLPER
ncbi:peptidoglycan DD-metalloendopeptidase family protein [Candidatus Omnitrophota bacterium]